MDRIGILGFIVTLISVISLSVVFTILFLNDFRNSKNEIEQGRLDIEFIDKQIDLEKKHERIELMSASLSGRPCRLSFLRLFLPSLFLPLSIESMIIKSLLVIKLISSLQLAR